MVIPSQHILYLGPLLELLFALERTTGKTKDGGLIGRRLTCAHKIDSAAHTGFWLTCAHKSVSVVHREASGDGVGLVNVIIFLAVQQTQALLIHDQLPVGWGGVGWGKNVHVPVHTRAQQPYHLSCCPADTGSAPSWSVTSGVGWGGVITFMFLCTHRHSNLIIFLAVQQTQALLIHDQLPVGWGNNVHEALRKMNARSTITNLVAVAPFYIYLTWGYRHGI